MRLTKYKLSILALALIIFASVTALFGLNNIRADASGTVTVSGTNVFTATGDATVTSSAVGEGEGSKYYATFTIKDGEEDGISYRRNLAYHWQKSVAAAEDDKTGPSVYGEEAFFSMELGFKELSFERFIVTFESQQYNKTKDKKSSNYVIFYPAAEGKVYALISTDRDAKIKDGETHTAIDAGNIEINFTAKLSCGYAVEVGAGDTYVRGEFENVGGNFAKSSTSSSSPLYPLIFNAEFAESEEEESENKAQMYLYEINGQSFEMSSATATTVTDNAPPVLCLTEEIRYFTQGGELDIDYVVIDVLRTSPTSTVYYYILSYDDYVDPDINNFNDKSMYKKAEDDALMESDYDKYLPDDAALLQGTKFNLYNQKDDTHKLTVDMMVKVYINLSDYSSDTYKETTDIYLDWYVPADYLITLNGGTSDESSFMAVAKDELGVTYNYDDGESGWADGANGRIAEYQAEVDKLAQNLSAGSSSYLYLPSAENLFRDNVSAYTDLKLSIYYYHNSQSSNTSLATNNLSINITQQGTYTFTIYATDAAGNNMYYIEDGVVKEFGADEIWDMFSDKDGGLHDKLPWFTFEVGYTGVSFEETPGMQSTAYVGTSYSSASFKINGISGSYQTKYRLFNFDRASYYNATGLTYSYEQFIGVMDGLYNNTLFTDEKLKEMFGDKFDTMTDEQLSDYRNTRKFFKEIPQVAEGDADYDKYKDYGWNSTSTTFTPQDANAFYYIRAEVVDTKYNTSPVTCGLAVVASENAKVIKGENDWFKNNVASVVLLSIAALAFIGIILLLVIKPKNKEDIDVQFEKKKAKKSK